MTWAMHHTMKLCQVNIFQDVIQQHFSWMHGLYRSYDPFQPLASDQSEGAQLTIFYNGVINVYDNVSTDKVTSTDSMHLVWNIITRHCYIKVLKTRSSKTRKLIVPLSAQTFLNIVRSYLYASPNLQCLRFTPIRQRQSCYWQVKVL